MQYKNLVTKRTWEQNGETKTKWLNVGTLKILDNGKMYIELNMFPTTTIYVFDNEKKEDKFHNEIQF